MLIVCPHCTTSYDLKIAALGAEGRSVRCTRCQTIWFASAQEPALEMAGELAADVMETPAEIAYQTDTAGDALVEAYEPEMEPAPDESQALSAEMAAPDMIDASPPLVPGQEIGQELGQETGREPVQEIQHQHQFTPGEGPFPMTGGDIDTFRRRRASKRAKQTWRLPVFPNFKWPLAPLPTLILGLAAAVIFLLGWRADAVRLLPQTASLYSAIGLGVNLRGVVFENIKTSREMNEGVPVMVVEGEIVSVSRNKVELPRLRFGVRNGLGAEIYNWTAMPGRTNAQPGERVAFRSRLASPPAETHDVSVRFYNRRDAMAGLR